MIQYTDVPLTFEVDGNVDLTEASDLHVTFSQGSAQVDTTSVTVIDATHFSLTLTERDTARFSAAKDLLCQLNFINAEGLRKATDQALIPVGSNLLRRFLHV